MRTEKEILDNLEEICDVNFELDIYMKGFVKALEWVLNEPSDDVQKLSSPEHPKYYSEYCSKSFQESCEFRDKKTRRCSWESTCNQKETRYDKE